MYIGAPPRGGNVDVNTKFFKRFTETDQMPCLFEPEEEEYDRYSACLAATEGLRRVRDRDLAEEMRQHGHKKGETELSEAEKHITAKYVQNSGKVLRALGMSVSQFNQLGRQISRDENLKERVREFR